MFEMSFIKIRVVQNLLFVFLLISFPTEAKQYSPKIVPAGWVDDFSYDGSLTEFLRASYITAQSEDKNLYVYFYSDSSIHCRKIRKLMKDARVRDAFQNAHVVMIDYVKYSASIDLAGGKKKDNRARAKRGHKEWHWQPLIVNVLKNGMLSKNIIFPDMHLHHRALLRPGSAKKSTVAVKQSSYYSKAPYITAMKNYFRKPLKKSN